MSTYMSKNPLMSNQMRTNAAISKQMSTTISAQNATIPLMSNQMRTNAPMSKQMSTPISTTQIPCKICQDPSTGIHYGVVSCDACKGFFGRQLKSRGRHIICPYNNNCNVKRSRKHVCAPCRFKRCLDVGMSKNAIKTGRYTLKWRQNLESELQHCAGSSPAVEQKKDVCPASDAWVRTTGLVNTNGDSISRKEDSQDSCHTGAWEADTISARLQPTARVGPNGESIEDLISTIVEAYEVIPSSIRSAQESLDKMAEHYLEQYKLKQTLFGKMPKVPIDEFTEIFKTTGIDVDDRFEFSEIYLNAVRKWIGNLVRFSKKIPGFKQLLIEDQFNLLKHNYFEFRFFGAYKGFNPDLETAVNPNGLCYHKEEIPKIHPLGAGDIIFDVANTLRHTRLTTEEHIIAQTMILFFPDRAPLQDRAAVENLQYTLLTCLEYLVSKRPTPQDRLRGLSQAIDMLTTIRKLTKVEDLTVGKDMWVRLLKNAKLKFLEQEMDVVPDTGEPC